MTTIDSNSSPVNDYPFYNSVPTRISGPQWGLVMLMVVIGFALLMVPIPFLENSFGQFLQVILFFAIPLLGLKIVAPGHWTAIFRKIRGRDVLWMILFTVLNLIVTFVVALLVTKLFSATPNEAIASAGSMNLSELAVFAVKVAIQLFGEELISILPFLAVLTFCFSRLKWSRKTAVLAAWLVSAVLFGLAHLSSYEWNILQCLLVIGTARLMLTLPYMVTKNIWVSTGVHILNDYIIILGPILAAAGGNG